MTENARAAPWRGAAPVGGGNKRCEPTPTTKEIGEQAKSAKRGTGYLPKGRAVLRRHEPRTSWAGALAMSTRITSPPMVSVFDGRKCLGIVLSRGPKGFEAFTADERSLGLFPTQADAANALSAAEA
jgi:hypothetical protein